MHQYSDPEGVAGFYTLKLDTEAKNLDEFSYTVAFEDRGDANNFCFLLESFFEDLGDVRVEILPLSVKVRTLVIFPSRLSDENFFAVKCSI